MPLGPTPFARSECFFYQCYQRATSREVATEGKWIATEFITLFFPRILTSSHPQILKSSNTQILTSSHGGRESCCQVGLPQKVLLKIVWRPNAEESVVLRSRCFADKHSVWGIVPSFFNYA